jgi:hypothetical protein
MPTKPKSMPTHDKVSPIAVFNLFNGLRGIAVIKSTRGGISAFGGEERRRRVFER